jgi:hypothetical protein
LQVDWREWTRFEPWRWVSFLAALVPARAGVMLNRVVSELSGAIVGLGHWLVNMLQGLKVVRHGRKLS